MFPALPIPLRSGKLPFAEFVPIPYAASNPSSALPAFEFPPAKEGPDERSAPTVGEPRGSEELTLKLSKDRADS